MTNEIKSNLEAMSKYVQGNNWILKEAIIDFADSCEGLFSLAEKANSIDIIIIYDKNNISDEFSFEFLYQLAQTEGIEVVEFNRN